MKDASGQLRVLVPRLFDAENTNAQNLNAKALLARFHRPDLTWLGLHYDDPDPDVAGNPRVQLVRLWRRQLWPWHVALRYQTGVDAIFYPGVEWFDAVGLKWRSRLGRRVPVIATLEGLAGDADTERMLSDAAGHPVHCHRVERCVLQRVRALLNRADHVIALSPFLVRMGKILHGDKFSELPLGVDTTRFYPGQDARSDRPLVVVSAGRVAPHKRPRIFLDMAQRFPAARFKWFGDGSDRRALLAEANARRLANVEFPGAKHPDELAQEFREADIFILPSLSEGAPKVAQEAGACGLPVIAFRFFEPPSVIDGETGFLVWSDEELGDRLAQLIGDGALRSAFGARAAAVARACDWDPVAVQWEERIAEFALRRLGS